MIDVIALKILRTFCKTLNAHEIVLENLHTL